MATPPKLPFAVRIHASPDSDDYYWVGELSSFTLDERDAEPDRLYLTEYRIMTWSLYPRW